MLIFAGLFAIVGCVVLITGILRGWTYQEKYPKNYRGNPIIPTSDSLKDWMDYTDKVDYGNM